jgi:hypothetical protein
MLLHERRTLHAGVAEAIELRQLRGADGDPAAVGEKENGPVATRGRAPLGVDALRSEVLSGGEASDRWVPIARELAEHWEIAAESSRAGLFLLVAARRALRHGRLDGSLARFIHERHEVHTRSHDGAVARAA